MRLRPFCLYCHPIIMPFAFAEGATLWRAVAGEGLFGHEDEAFAPRKRTPLCLTSILRLTIHQFPEIAGNSIAVGPKARKLLFANITKPRQDIAIGRFLVLEYSE